MPNLAEAHIDMTALQEFKAGIVFLWMYSACGLLVSYSFTRTLIGHCHHLGRYTL